MTILLFVQDGFSNSADAEEGVGGDTIRNYWQQTVLVFGLCSQTWTVSRQCPQHCALTVTQPLDEGGETCALCTAHLTGQSTPTITSK